MISDRVLITCDAESDAFALEELRQFGLASTGTWLDTGDAVQGSILLVDPQTDFATFAEDLDTKGSIFIRHLAPVQHELELTGTESDLGIITVLLPEIAAKIDPTKSFSVQTRILGTGKLPYRKVVVNETISLALEQSLGASMDCRHPEQVISILCSPTRAYVGVSLTEQNRSEWPGGKHRFKKEDDQVSRAEFKLLEAMSVFGFEFPTKGQALDIGASPGGWTRVLASRGLTVDAVDPGNLDARIRGHRNVRHLRRRIQEYQPGNKRFAAIVNDMKMDARESIGHMLQFASRLMPGGVAVITLKMPKGGHPRRTLDMLREDLALLETGFDLVGARQLYHNRSEVTVVLAPKA